MIVGLLLMGTFRLVGVDSTRLGQPYRSILFAGAYLSLAAYFITCWRRGQTLPMRAWRLRLVGPGSMPLRWTALAIRFVVASAVWGLALIALVWLREHPTSVMGWLGVIPWAVAIAWCARDPERQTLYDRLAGTRLMLDERSLSPAPERSTPPSSTTRSESR